MDKIKDISRRGSILLIVAAFLGSWLSTLPVVAFADDFDTSEFAHRILLLSSSSPGWSYTDGAGNSGPDSDAPPGSGPDGLQTAEQFNITTNSNNDTTSGGKPIEAFTFQYCTAAAGHCKAPGNDGYASGSPGTGDAGYVLPANECDSGCTGRNADSVTGQTSDLNVVFASPSEAASSVVGTAGDAGVLVDSTTGQMLSQPDPTTTGGNFVVLEETGTAPNSWVYSAGWSASVTDNEDSTTGSFTDGQQTGRNNYITLTNTTGITDAPHGTPLEVIFFATNTNYITNPGAEAFFVKMADYSGTTPDSTPTDTGYNLMDGGVTVANVMTQSIEITTKVLETMSFSVGVTDPYTDSSQSSYGGCDPLEPTNADITNAPPNGIALGNPSLEYSLDTSHAYDAYSLWRLSTNSAYGGTIYYSGDTLKSTEDSQITPLSAESYPKAGENQFGVGLNNSYPTDPTFVSTVTYPDTSSYYDTHALTTSYVNAFLAHQNPTDKWYLPNLDNMVPSSGYGDAEGTLTYTGSAPGPQFDFSSTANTSPVAIATESSGVIQCATGQMRYVADIAGYTPAGIYTTKINYLAAPEY